MTDIPVSVVHGKMSGRLDSEANFKFHDVPMPVDHPVVDELTFVKDYVKRIEIEFAGQVEGILDELQLSHLRFKPKKESD
jgi:hypothetical protein